MQGQTVYLIAQAPQKMPQARDYLSLAKFSGGFAGLFILMQILGMLYEIFILEQRLLDPDQKLAIIGLIILYVIKNAYAMVLIGCLFIMTPQLVKSMTIPSWVILVIQSVYSIWSMVAHFSKSS